MALFRLISKSHTLLDSAWSCRGFVSATIPSHKKIDKETCEKVIDAAETVKDGTKEVVGEVKRITKTISEKAATATGTVTAEMAKKGFEHASESVKSEKGKDILDAAKTVAETLKDKADKKLDK